MARVPTGLRTGAVAVLLIGCRSEPTPPAATSSAEVASVQASGSASSTKKRFPPWRFPPSFHQSRRDREARAAAAEPPRSLAELTTPPGGARCPEGQRLKLFVLNEEGVTVDTTTTDAMKLPGHITLAEGRHRGTAALPLRALLPHQPGAGVVEVWPCDGEVVRYAAAALDALVLVPASGGQLKLLDTASRRGKVLSNIAAVRVTKR